MDGNGQRKGEQRNCFSVWTVQPKENGPFHEALSGTPPNLILPLGQTRTLGVSGPHENDVFLSASWCAAVSLLRTRNLPDDDEDDDHDDDHSHATRVHGFNVRYESGGGNRSIRMGLPDRADGLNISLDWVVLSAL